MGTGDCVLVSKCVDPLMKNKLGRPVPDYVIARLQGIVDSGKPRPKTSKVFQAEKNTNPPPPAEAPTDAEIATAYIAAANAINPGGHVISTALSDLAPSVFTPNIGIINFNFASYNFDASKIASLEQQVLQLTNDSLSCDPIIPPSPIDYIQHSGEGYEPSDSQSREGYGSDHVSTARSNSTSSHRSFRRPRVTSAHVTPTEICLSDNTTSLIPPGCHEFLIDGGANVPLVRDTELIRAGTPVDVPPLSITGVSNHAGPLGAPVISLTFKLIQRSQPQPLFWTLSCGATSASNRNILPESGLWDLFGAQCLKEPHLAIRTHNYSIAMIRRNGLYFTLLRLVTNDSGDACMVSVPDPAANYSECNLAHAYAASHPVHLYQLWFARTGAHTERQIRGTMVSKGIPFTKLSGPILRAIKEDEAAALSLIRRAPAPPLGHPELISR